MMVSMFCMSDDIRNNVGLTRRSNDCGEAVGAQDGWRKANKEAASRVLGAWFWERRPRVSESAFDVFTTAVLG